MCFHNSMSVRSMKLAARYGRKSSLIEILQDIIDEKYHVNAVLIGEAMMKSHDKRHTLEVLKGIDEED